MKKEPTVDQPIPKGFRIRSVSEVYQSRHQNPKFVVEQKFLGFWIRVKKPCLDVTTEYSGAHYSDRQGRGYSIVHSDGNCRTYDDALEFLHYKPMNLYMLSESGKKVLELWANNSIARNFIHAGIPYKKYHVSRVGLFLNASPQETHFQAKGDYWESFYSERYGMHKIAS